MCAAPSDASGAAADCRVGLTQVEIRLRPLGSVCPASFVDEVQPCSARCACLLPVRLHAYGRSARRRKLSPGARRAVGHVTLCMELRIKKDRTAPGNTGGEASLGAATSCSKAAPHQNPVSLRDHLSTDPHPPLIKTKWSPSSRREPSNSRCVDCDGLGSV